MPALNGCICGTVLVTCIESLLPSAASSGVAPDRILAARHVPAREQRFVPVALVPDLLTRRNARDRGATTAA